MVLLYVDPVAGKTLKFPFNEKWDDIKNGFSKGGKNLSITTQSNMLSLGDLPLVNTKLK
jgi:hypothetical protein